MKNLHEFSSSYRVFFLGALGGVFGVLFMFLCAYSAFVYYSPVRNFVRDAVASAFLPAQTPPLVDSSGAVDSVVSVVAAANPAVVSLVVTKEVPNIEQYYSNQSPFGGLFPGFSFPSYRQNGTKEEEVAGGTGFFISADGYLVTNHHVIDVEESSYTVYLNDETSYAATLVASDPYLDIALLKVDAPDKVFSFLTFGDSTQVQVGQTAVAIGNALGEYRNTVSVGVISGLSRTVIAQTSDGDAERLQDILQTDAAINPGNSGGPLLDLAGKVIGVNVAASVGGAENIGFALPANAVKNVVDSLRENGRLVRPFLGVRSELVTPEFAEREGLSVAYGALVRRTAEGDLAVIPGSPADKAGIEENDIILMVNNERIDASHDLAYAISLHAPGDTVTLRVLHDGEERDVAVTLVERPAQE